MRNYNELMEMLASHPPIQWIWGGIKDVSFGFLYGAAKSGKTILLENLLMALAMGQEEFWGLPLPGKPIKTLFVSLEEFILNRADRLQKQTATLTEAERVLLNDNYALSDENFPTFFTDSSDWQKLKDEILKSKAKVVVIDSLTRVSDKKMESRDEAKVVLQRLRNLAYDNKICIIVIHHSVKSAGKSLDQTLMAGSSVLAAEADFIYGISKTSKGDRYIKEVDLRYKEEDSEQVHVFRIDSNACIEPVGAAYESSLLKESDGRFGSDLQDKLEDFVNKRGTIKTSEALKHFETLNYSGRTIEYSLAAIVKAGKIKKLEKRGHYSKLG